MDAKQKVADVPVDIALISLGPPVCYSYTATFGYWNSLPDTTQVVELWLLDDEDALRGFQVKVVPPGENTELGLRTLLSAVDPARIRAEMWRYDYIEPVPESLWLRLVRRAMRFVGR